MLVAPIADAQRTRLRDEAGRCRFHRSSFIGSDAGAHGVVAAQPAVPTDSRAPYPVAYRIELDPRSDLDVHFHRANQFQVFVDGDGHLARHPVQPVTVHYAGAHTAYGPIRPGPRGLTFFTLRDAWDPGARFLPEHKDELRLAGRVRREAFALAPSASEAAGLPAATDQVLLSSDVDAMGAWAVRRAPGTALDAPAAAGSGGAFWLVLAGGLELAGQAPLAPMSCAFLAADETPPQAVASAAGLYMLVLRLPARCAPAAGAGPG